MAEDIVSKVLDPQLLLTIAQVSATFVAVLAVFYTTKIISLANEKNTLLQKIKVYDNEIEFRNKELAKLDKSIADIDRAKDEEIIDSFIQIVKGDFFVYEQVHSFEDLRSYFKKLYDIPPSEYQEKILKDKSLKVLEELEELRNKRKDRVQHPDLTATIYHPPYEPKDDIQTALYNQEEIRQINELRNKKKDERTKISFLKNAESLHEVQLQSIIFPNIRLGLFSFILFAILGVVIPLSYRWWTIPLVDLIRKFNIGFEDINVIVVILFCIGLAVSFVYIAKELYHVLNVEKKKVLS